MIVFILTSFNPFRYFGQDAPPTWWIWCIENKLYACLMIFFLCNALEGHLVSTGAFEISLNGKLSYILYILSYILHLKDQNNILGIVYLLSLIKLLWKPVIGLCEVCNFAEYLINIYCIKYK